MSHHAIQKLKDSYIGTYPLNDHTTLSADRCVHRADRAGGLSHACVQTCRFSQIDCLGRCWRDELRWRRSVTCWRR
jgi:hypothetical protein